MNNNILMDINGAGSSGSLQQSTSPAQAVTAVQALLENKTDLSAGQGPDSTSNSRPLRLDLVLFNADILINAGEFAIAGRLLEQELRKNPHCLPLLMRLGRLDEAQGQNLNAFDLYRQLGSLAETGQQQVDLAKVLERARGKVYCDLRYQAGSYALHLRGNSRPLELHFKLKQQQERLLLLETILTRLDSGAGSVFEVECSSGLISRTLSALGYRVESTASSMNDLIMAIGFESAEALQHSSDNLPSYYNLDFTPALAAELELKDAVLVLPSDLDWYRLRGAAASADLLRELAGRARSQFFYYIPAALDPGDQAAGQFQQQLKELLAPGNRGLFARAELIYRQEGENGGSLYLLQKKKCPAGRGAKAMPHGLEALKSRSEVFTLQPDRCRVAAKYIPQQDPEAAAGKFETGARLPWEEQAACEAGAACGPGAKDQFSTHLNSPVPLEYLNQQGYLPELFPGGYIRGYFLKRGSDYRFLVTDGKKRLSAAVQQGADNIKCKLDPAYQKVVTLDTVSDWPGVKNGHYSADQASALFNHIFDENNRSW